MLLAYFCNFVSMKGIKYLVFLILLSTSAYAQDADSLTFISLNPSEFHEEMSMVNNPVLVDVREFFEYRKSRIPGAVNLPSSGSIETFVDTIDRATHLFFYCTSDFRSKRVAGKFIAKGFVHVYSLDVGISGWKKKGFPVERKKVRRKK